MNSQYSEHDDISEWKSAGREAFSLISLSWQSAEKPPPTPHPPPSLPPPLNGSSDTPPAAEAQWGFTEQRRSLHSLNLIEWLKWHDCWSDTMRLQQRAGPWCSKTSQQRFYCGCRILYCWSLRLHNLAHSLEKILRKILHFLHLFLILFSPRIWGVGVSFALQQTWRDLLKWQVNPQNTRSIQYIQIRWLKQGRKWIGTIQDYITLVLYETAYSCCFLECLAILYLYYRFDSSEMARNNGETAVMQQGPLPDLNRGCRVAGTLSSCQDRIIFLYPSFILYTVHTTH